MNRWLLVAAWAAGIAVGYAERLYTEPACLGSTGIYQGIEPLTPLHIAYDGEDIATCEATPEKGNWFMCQIHGYPWADVGP